MQIKTLELTDQMLSREQQTIVKYQISALYTPNIKHKR